MDAGFVIIPGEHRNDWLSLVTITDVSIQELSSRSSHPDTPEGFIPKEVVFQRGTAVVHLIAGWNPDCGYFLQIGPFLPFIPYEAIPLVKEIECLIAKQGWEIERSVFPAGTETTAGTTGDSHP